MAVRGIGLEVPIVIEGGTGFTTENVAVGLSLIVRHGRRHRVPIPIQITNLNIVNFLLTTLLSVDLRARHTRKYAPTKNQIAFILLNPSTIAVLTHS